MRKRPTEGLRIGAWLALAVAAVVALTLSVAMAQDTETIDELLERRITWITEHYPELAYNGERLPEVQSVPNETLLGMTGMESGRDILAVYNQDVNNIYLRDDLDPFALGVGYVLIHELVHYLQHLRDPVGEDECLRKREPEAYKAQEQFQREFGPWPLEWNWLFVVMISTCSDGPSAGGWGQ